MRSGEVTGNEKRGAGISEYVPPFQMTDNIMNPLAEKAYLRAGFKREGVLRDAVLDRGQYADDILMAILEDDWLKLKESR